TSTLTSTGVASVVRANEVPVGVGWDAECLWKVRLGLNGFMPVTFNHSILAARDRHKSAQFLTELFGLEEPTSWGPFTQVKLDGGVFIQFAEPPVAEIQMQHYAFLVDDDRFDQILARVRARGIPYTADPNPS